MNQDRGRIVIAAVTLAVMAFVAASLPRLTAARPPIPAPALGAPESVRVHTMTLSGGRTLGVYLDPGQAGPNGVHGTITDAQGRGLDLARAPIVTATGPAGRPTLLAVLLEGPGHFYADGDFAPGEWNLQIEATTRAGEVLHTQFTVRL